MNKIEENNNENDSQGNTSNSDNVNENGKRGKKRSTKKELYRNEREEIIKKINNLLGIDETKNYVISAVIKNAGKQFTSFNTTNTYPLLTDFQLGFAHKLKHAPIRFSYVIHHIQKFDLSYLNPNQSTKVDPLTGEPIVITKTNFAQKVGMHLLPQVEFLFSKNIHFRFAFDYLRRSQMKLENRPGMAGISFGLSMHFKRFSFEYALSSYSVAGYLNGFTFTTNINKWRKSTLK